MGKETDCNNGFLFYESYYRAAEQMNSRDRASFVLAMCAYIFDGVEPDLKGAAGIAWTLTKPVVDSNQKRREAGKKGGRPGKNKTIGLAETETNGFENQEPNSIYDKGQGTRDKGHGMKDNNSALSPAEPTASVSLLSEIESFCLAHGGTPADAAVFYAQYDKAGWKAGGQPIENWPGLCMGFLRNGGAKAAKRVTAFDAAAAEEERKRKAESRASFERMIRVNAEWEEQQRLEEEQKRRELEEAGQ